MVEASNKAEQEAKQKAEEEEETPEQEDARKKAERERLDALQKPLVEDKKEWEATLSEAEKQKFEDFEKSLRVPEDEGGDAAREAFTKEVDETFANADEAGNGLLNQEGLKNFFIVMNENGVQKELKAREVTDEWITKAWPVFNGYNTKTEGVSKEDLLETLYDIEIAL